MTIDEMDQMRSEEKARLKRTLTVILKQFQSTGDINQAVEDIFIIIGEG